MTGRIFISYRRDDEQGFAVRLYERLSEALGRENLFFDADSIPPGFDFVDYIASQIELSDIVLVVIGKGWLNATDEDGQRRLENPEDFVRIEVEAALNQKKHIIPVLVQGAKMPVSTQLPPSLQPLARRNAVFATHVGFRHETDRLLAQMRGILDHRAKEAATAAERRAEAEALARTQEAEAELARLRAQETRYAAPPSTGEHRIHADRAAAAASSNPNELVLNYVPSLLPGGRDSSAMSQDHMAQKRTWMALAALVAAIAVAVAAYLAIARQPETAPPQAAAPAAPSVTTPPEAAPATPPVESPPAPPVAAPQPAEATPPQPAETTPPSNEVAGKALYYQEKTSSSADSAEPGSAVWSLVQESPGANEPPEPAVRADVSYPGAGVSIRMTLRRNADKTLPASHIIEFVFVTDEKGDPIDNVLRIAAKVAEGDTGDPLNGFPAKIADGFFLVALNDTASDKAANLELLTGRSWFDIAVVQKTGRRGLFTFEKGPAGTSVINDAVKAWAAKGG